MENVCCVGALFLLPLAIYASAFLTPALPLSVQPALFEPPWEEGRPPGMTPPPHDQAGTETASLFPWYRFMHDAVHAGDSVLWNPNEAFGSPFLALWRTRVLSPFSLPFYVLPLGAAFRMSALLKMILAGLCALYAARRFGFPVAMALFVGITYQLGAVFYVWPAHPMADSAVWFPLLLPFCERLLLRQPHAWPLGAVIFGLIALGGSPEMLAVSILFAAVYLVARRFRDHDWRHLGGASLTLAFATTVALALAAVQIVPFAEYVLQGGATGSPHEVLRITDLMAAFAPSLVNLDRSESAPTIALLYVGLPSLLLLALWLALRDFAEKALRRRTEALFLAGAGLAAIPILLAGWLPSVPGLGMIGARHFLAGTVLTFAFVAAAAAEEWNLLDPQDCKAAIRRLLLYIPALWGVLFVGIGLTAFRQEDLGGQFRYDYVAACLIAVGLLSVLGLTVFRPSVRITSYALCVLSAFSLWWGFHGLAPRTEERIAFPETPFVRSLIDMDSRVSGSAALQRWPLAANGIPQAFNPAGGATGRYWAFMREVDKDPLLLRRTGSEALLLTKEDIRGAFAATRPVLNIQAVYPSGAVLFRDLQTQPRARIIYAARCVPKFNPEALDASLPPLLEDASLPPEDDGPVAKASVEGPSSHGRVLVRTEETRPGVLVLADGWYPGWRAHVDGRPAEVVPVDGVFRGVEIGEGKHKVLFEYRPASFQVGRAISALAFVFLLVGLRHSIFRKKSPRAAS